MSRYIEWDDIVARYEKIGTLGGAAELGSSYIDYVERQVEGLLASRYSVPFSSNNITVKDLCIELSYIRMSGHKSEKAKEMREVFMERIERLKNGEELMMTDSYEVIYATGEPVWSTTQDYHSVFVMDDIEFSVIDSNQIEDERNDRGFTY